MNCETANEFIMKYFDLEINDIEEAQLLQHLKSCKSCNEEFLCMKNAFTALEATEKVEPPEVFEVQVMEKISAIADAQKKRYANMLVLLYNATSIMSIALLLFFVADIKYADFRSITSSFIEYFNSFTSAASDVFDVVRDLFGLVADVIVIIVEVFSTIVKAYYLVIFAMLALLAAIQRLLALYAPQDGRNA